MGKPMVMLPLAELSCNTPNYTNSTMWKPMGMLLLAESSCNTPTVTEVEALVADFMHHVETDPEYELDNIGRQLMAMKTGKVRKYILSSLSRLVPAPSIFSPPCHDWFPLRV
eukprot:2185216-Pyramimonas_sp.AAC.1